MAGQIVLRQVGPIDGRSVVGAEQANTALVLKTAQHIGGREARRPAAHDDDAVGRCRAHGQAFGLRLGRFLAVHKEPAIAFFHQPAC